MTARPLSALLPTGLPVVTLSEVRGLIDAELGTDVTGPRDNLLSGLTFDREDQRKTLGRSVRCLRRARRCEGHESEAAMVWGATVLMLWRLSREVGR